MNVYNMHSFPSPSLCAWNHRNSGIAAVTPSELAPLKKNAAFTNSCSRTDLAEDPVANNVLLCRTNASFKGFPLNGNGKG